MRRGREDIAMDRREALLPAFRQALAHLISSFTELLQFKVSQAERKMERRRQPSAGAREWRGENTNGLRDVFGRREPRAILREQRFAQFRNNLRRRLRRH